MGFQGAQEVPPDRRPRYSCRVLALIVTLSLCTVAAVALIWRYDLYDKEPWWAILIAVGLGAAGMFAVASPQEALAAWVGNAPSRFAFVAASTEESMKLGIVLLIAAALRRVFNDPVDGIIYGSLVGLGCAVEESVAYYIDPVSRPWGPPTEVIRIMGHLIFGGLSGFGVGLFRSATMDRRRARAYFAVGFGSAVLLHYLWDVLAASAFVRSTPTNFDRVAQVGLMLAGFGAYAVILCIAWAEARKTFRGEHWRRLLSSPARRRTSAGS